MICGVKIIIFLFHFIPPSPNNLPQTTLPLQPSPYNPPLITPPPPLQPSPLQPSPLQPFPLTTLLLTTLPPYNPPPYNPPPLQPFPLTTLPLTTLPLCSLVSLECIRISSNTTITPGNPANICVIFFWNISLALLNPKGILVYLNLPIGVLNVVSWLSLSGGAASNRFLSLGD